ncbi:MAG: rod shape-determining protein MreC [Actinomycetota bacterium]|nr:rod shape-determining protein MreC [Actinomycetota bacterium]
MHDKQVRRRRAVLLALVAVSLILLTAYFGESPGSPLHTIQRGLVQVLAPLQEGASKALKPVRDIAGWFSSTLHAKARNAELEKQVQALQAKLAQDQYALNQNTQLRRLIGLDQAIGIANYHSVTASVIARDPTLWYARIEVDKGSQEGIHLNDPVIGDRGLVGRVSLVASSVSFVTLITDPSMAVAAGVPSGDTGVLVPAVGNPNQLLLQNLAPGAQVQAGQEVATVGFKFHSLEDLYPAGIPIGTVVSTPANGLPSGGQVQVAPVVDLRHLDVVQILTAPHLGSQRAQVPGG